MKKMPRRQCHITHVVRNTGLMLGMFRCKNGHQNDMHIICAEAHTWTGITGTHVTSCAQQAIRATVRQPNIQADADTMEVTLLLTPHMGGWVGGGYKNAVLYIF
jgi:hypothetical protein